MDLITHLPTSESLDSVFTIVDRFSKYITFIPCNFYSLLVQLLTDLECSMTTLFIRLACHKR